MFAKPGSSREARFDSASQHRRSMIGKIQVARHQLRMDDDDYRQVLFDSTGQTSLTTCNEAQLGLMIDRMKKLGFQPRPAKGAAAHPMARKARALWISLHHLGAVHNPSEPALEAFAKRQLGCDKLVWARQSDAYRLIEALKAMAERAGWSQSPASHGEGGPSLVVLQKRLCEAILAKMKAAEVVPADWSLDIAGFRLCGEESLREQAWSIEDYQRLAAQLGKRARELGVYASEMVK